MKKNISLLLLFLTLLALIAGCTTEKNFRDDTAPDILLENAERKLYFQEGVTPTVRSEISLKLAPGLSAVIPLSDRYILKDTAGESCDEYGIIHIENPKNVESATVAVREYLTHKQQSIITDGYSDADKFDEWEVHVFGNYIVFAVMTAENKAVFFKEIEQLLLEV